VNFTQVWFGKRNHISIGHEGLQILVDFFKGHCCLFNMIFQPLLHQIRESYNFFDSLSAKYCRNLIEIAVAQDFTLKNERHNSTDLWNEIHNLEQHT